VGIERDGRTHHHFADTLSDLEQNITDIQQSGQNVFVALSTFDGYSRRADNALYCRSFFIDMDVGAGNPKKYESKEAALADLRAFVEQNDLPPPVLVDSGGGVHAYWPFDRDVPISEWKPYADKFKQLCIDHIKIDPVVTADAARIMRCPDTLNLKTDPPNPAVLLTDEFHQYDFDVFKAFLGEVEYSIGSILDLIPKGLDEDTLKIAKLDNFETTFQDIAEKSLEGQGCNQIKNAIVNAQTLSEPVWHSALSIARHCTDWETSIHLLSEDYAGYNREATIRKANETFGKPHSCATFEQRNPGGCDGCPLKGRITNPLAIGRRFVAAPSEEISEEDAVRIASNPEEVPTFPKAVYPFVRGRNGGIYYVPPAEIGDDGEKTASEPILISQNEFYPVKRMYGESDGEILLVRVKLPHEVREKYISTGDAQSVDSMKEIIGKAGVAPPSQTLWPKLVEYMTKWLHYLQSQNAADKICHQMGWTDDNTFLIGENEIIGVDNSRKAASSPLIRSVSRLMTPKGDYQVWKDCVNQLNHPELEMQAFGLFVSFGSPLMRYTSTNGMTFCFTGPSGAAKSGSLYAGLSVWGAPKPLSVYDSTDNAFNSRAMSLKNILMGMDEVQEKPPEQISKLIHLISQGKGKMRMQSSVNAEREQQEIASMLCLMSSNVSLYDMIFVKKANASGEIMRLLEYVLMQPPSLTMEMGKRIFDPLHANHGHAGPDFIGRVIALGDTEIRARIAKWSKRVTATKLGSNAAFRFYETAFSAIFAGAEIANEFGIISFDVDRIFDRVILETIKVRDNTQKNRVTDYEGLIGEFLNDHWRRGTLIFDEGRLVNEPTGELVARVEIGNSTQYIAKSKFKQFLTSKSVGTGEFERALERSSVSLESKKMRLSTGWKAGMTTPPIHVYAFQYEVPKELLDDNKTDGA
jgi:hypothetical protein